MPKTLEEIAERYGHFPMRGDQFACSGCSTFGRNGLVADCTFLAALREAVAEEREALREIVEDVREHETAVCSSVNTWRYCCDELLDRLTASRIDAAITDDDADMIDARSKP